MNRRPKQILVVFLTMLFAALIFSGGWVRSAVAQDEVNPGEQSSEAVVPLAQSEHSCTISNVTAYLNRIHVRCTLAPAAAPGVFWFASPTDAANIRVTNQFLTLLNTAYAMGTTVGVHFETSNTANPPGCNLGDCRKLVGITLYK